MIRVSVVVEPWTGKPYPWAQVIKAMHDLTNWQVKRKSQSILKIQSTAQFFDGDSFKDTLTSRQTFLGQTLINPLKIRSYFCLEYI